MRSRLHSWTDTLTKLGFTRERRKNRAKSGFARKLRVEALEPRQVLSANIDTLSVAGDRLFESQSFAIDATVPVNSTATSISFYWDANRNGLFDDSVSGFIATDSNEGDGWSVSDDAADYEFVPGPGTYNRKLCSS